MNRNEFDSHPEKASAKNRLQRAFGAAMAIHASDPHVAVIESGEYPEFESYGSTPYHFNFSKTFVGSGEPSFSVRVSTFDTNSGYPTKPLYTFTLANGYVKIIPALVDREARARNEAFGLLYASDVETYSQLGKMKYLLEDIFPQGIVIPDGGEKGQPTKATKGLVSTVLEGMPYQITRKLSHWEGEDDVEYQVETEAYQVGVPREVVFKRKTVSSKDFEVYTVRTSSWKYTDDEQSHTIEGRYRAADVTSQASGDLDRGIWLMRDPLLLESVAREGNSIFGKKL